MNKTYKLLGLTILLILFSQNALLAITGDSCNDPFTISSLPFWHESTTVDFSADYDLGEGNSCTGHTTAGKDVVYKFTVPDTLDTVCITLSVIIPQEIWDAAIYILTDCGNMVCAAGADEYGEGSPEALVYPLSPGETYYFIVDGKNSWDEGHYKFAVSDCATGVAESNHRGIGSTLGLSLSPSITERQLTIEFDVTKKSHVDVAIYDLSGKFITSLLSSTLTAGHKKILWSCEDLNGKPLKGGVYFVRVKANSLTAVARFLLISR
jgi:hypothetical protein